MMKNMQWPVLFCSALLMLLTTSCNNSDEHEPIEGDIVLTAGINLRAVDTFRNVFISSATETLFNCSNFELDADTKVEKGALEICFTQITTHALCDRTQGPAQHMWNLGAAAPGEYPIEVWVEKVKSVGQLVVEDSTAYFKFEDLKRIQTP